MATSQNSTHKYPRVAIKVDIPGVNDYDDACKLVVKEPGGNYHRYDRSGNYLNTQRDETYFDSILIKYPQWREDFSHHEPDPETKQLQTRCAIVYLKSLVKDQRERIKALEARVKELEDAGA